MSKLVIAIMILLHLQNIITIDLLYEIKYWNNPVSKATLARLVNQIEKRGISYENTAHRNFRFIILIISQEDWSYVKI